MQDVRPECERRASPRYKLQLPVVLEWMGDAGKQVEAGFTHDVSKKAARVMCSAHPAMNSAVHILIALPTGATTTPPRVGGRGQVARILTSEEGQGVVIAADLNTLPLGQSESVVSD